MVVRCYVFETRGGQLLAEVEPSDLTGSVRLNAAEEIEATFDLTGTIEGSRDWRNLGTPWKHSLAVDVEGQLFGGPILPHQYSADDGSLKIAVRGLRVLLSHRFVLPVAALTRPLVLADGSPDTTLDTRIVGFDLGTIGMKLCQQAFAWPGWTDIPVVWQSPRAGTSERNYAAVDLKDVDSALDDLSGVENGPDFRFELRWADDDRFEWVFDSGSQAQPRLMSPDIVPFEVETGLAVTTDPTRMGSVAWSQGGRSDDTTIIRMRYDPVLIDHGFPLLELESSASNTTVNAATLDDWNVETLRTARRPWEFWTFRAPVDRMPHVGDRTRVTVAKQDVPQPADEGLFPSPSLFPSPTLFPGGEA